jgi:predicted ATPase
MELIEVEFQNYASFQTCRVPIQSGITVLVGRNNVGKTAILRGISILDVVSTTLGTSLLDQLIGYVSGRSIAAPFLDLKVKFRLEQIDAGMIGSLQWAELIRTNDVTLLFDVFVRLSPPGSAYFGECELRYPGGQLSLLQRERDGMLGRYQYQNTNSQAISVGASFSDSINHPVKARANQPVGRATYITPLPPDLASGFRGLKPVRIVEAHRAVRSQVPLQTTEGLSANAEQLATFLLTLRGRRPAQYDEIQNVVTTVFPEFRYVNAEDTANTVTVTFAPRAGGKNISLVHCGTGVEQILTLATFVITSPSGSIICIDEPHSYLHPAAERELISFLQEHAEHKYLIATHSPVIVNSVPADRILNVIQEEGPVSRIVKGADVPTILRSLGYRNSDFLFSDRLIFVEGPSDQAIVPMMLAKTGKVAEIQIEGTGFPNLGGTPGGTGRAKRLQTAILKYEKVVAEIGRASIPRMYLFDGDFADDEKRLLQGTAIEGDRIKVRFLPRREIENYLLVPSAIESVLAEELSAAGQQSPTAPEVEEAFRSLMTDARLYANAESVGDITAVKGSALLGKVFEKFNIPFSKTATGPRLANYVTVANQIAIQDFWNLTADLF